MSMSNIAVARSRRREQYYKAVRLTYDQRRCLFTNYQHVSELKNSTEDTAKRTLPTETGKPIRMRLGVVVINANIHITAARSQAKNRSLRATPFSGPYVR